MNPLNVKETIKTSLIALKLLLYGTLKTVYNYWISNKCNTLVIWKIISVILGLRFKERISLGKWNEHNLFLIKDTSVGFNSP